MPSIYWTRSVSRKSNGFSFLEGLCKLKNSSNLLTNAHIFRYRLIACHLDTEHNDWLWKLLWSNARQWYRDLPDYESAQMMLKGSFGPRPTDPFTILELQNPSYDAPELHEIRWSPDCKTRAGGQSVHGSPYPVLEGQKIPPTKRRQRKPWLRRTSCMHASHGWKSTLVCFCVNIHLENTKCSSSQDSLFIPEIWIIYLYLCSIPTDVSIVNINYVVHVRDLFQRKPSNTRYFLV